MGERRRHFITVRICAVLLSLGVFAVVAEGVVAIGHYSVKANLKFVPGIGGVYIPGAYYRHTKEGFSEGYFNSHGFRDVERTYAKPKDTFRILVLGDSYVEAFQVALEKSFPSILEKKLNENGNGKKIEVLNLGQSGFGTSDEYLRYLNEGVKYSPDLVLVAFLTGNDFRNNSKALNWDGIGFYHDVDKDGNLVLDRSVIDGYQNSLTPLHKIFHIAKEHSYIANLISERLFLLRFQTKFGNVGQSVAAEEHSATPLGQLSDLNIYSPDMGPHWKHSVVVTQAILRHFRSDVEKTGAQFVLVTLSNAEQLDPQLQTNLKEQYNIQFDFEQPDRILAEFATQQHMHYLQLMPIFRQYHLETGRNLHGWAAREVGHWNENGHQLAAETIFDFLKDQDLIH